MDLNMDYGDTYFGMVSLVAVVTRPKHSGERVSTYVARMFALCRKVDILDDDDLGGWLPRWYVVEDDNDFQWGRM